MLVPRKGHSRARSYRQMTCFVQGLIYRNMWNPWMHGSGMGSKDIAVTTLMEILKVGGKSKHVLKDKQ